MKTNGGKAENLQLITQVTVEVTPWDVTDNLLPDYIRRQIALLTALPPIPASGWLRAAGGALNPYHPNYDLVAANINIERQRQRVAALKGFGTAGRASANKNRSVNAAARREAILKRYEAEIHMIGDGQRNSMRAVIGRIISAEKKAGREEIGVSTLQRYLKNLPRA